MRFEELQKIKILINTSQLLNPIEKAEWLQLLPNMNDRQINDLAVIITPKTPHSKPVAPRFPDLKEKEISTSIPVHELEIAQHAGQTPAPKPLGSPAPANPEELQRKVEKIVKEFGQPVSEQPQQHPAVNKVINNPLTIPVEGYKKVPLVEPNVFKGFESNESGAPVVKTIHPELGILKKPEDFSAITPEMLHDHDSKKFFDQIFNAITAGRPHSEIFAVIEAFESSPLYQTYVNFGTGLLNDPEKDREKSYNTLLKYAQSQGQSYLTHAEFEATADFRSEIDKFFV